MSLPSVLDIWKVETTLEDVEISSLIAGLTKLAPNVSEPNLCLVDSARQEVFAEITWRMAEQLEKSQRDAERISAILSEGKDLPLKRFAFKKVHRRLDKLQVPSVHLPLDTYL